MAVNRTKHNKVMLFTYYLGIDISKMTLDAALIVGEGKIVGQTKVTNDKKGFRELMLWMKKQKVGQSEVLMCAEHTGVYGYDLQVWLDDNDYCFSFVSPLEIKKSLGIRRGKNDTVDAVRIAEYAYIRRESIQLSHKPSEVIFQLRSLLSERKFYVRTHSSLLARKDAQHKYETPISRRRREATLNRTSKYIKSLDREMEVLIKQVPDILRNYNLIRSINGIG